MTELDIWRAANILLKRCVGDAVFIASKRADALLDQGDVQGCSAWVRIVKHITDLERKIPAGGEHVQRNPALADKRPLTPRKLDIRTAVLGANVDHTMSRYS